MVSEHYRLIGARLRRAREEAHLSRREVVEEMKRRGHRASVSSLQDVEAGKRIQLSTLLVLSDILGRHPTAVLGIGPPDDVTPDDLELLVERSTKISDLEKEFLYAAIAHIRHLRAQLEPILSIPVAPIDPSPGDVRSAILGLLGSGGAFSAKEIASQPAFSSVPETLLHRELLYLSQADLVSAVSSQPARYALVEPK